RSPPIVTPGWISRVCDVGGGSGIVVSSVGGGAVGVVGTVSSAPAVAENATKSTTEQGRMARVASRRMRGECSRMLYGVREGNGRPEALGEDPRVVRDHAVDAR